MSGVRIVDTTLRDGQQCLWATRMPTWAMLPMAEAFDRVGFQAIELMGSVHFDACVRYLKEDPWTRIRLLRERIVETPIQGFLRSGCVLGFNLQAADINCLYVACLIEAGLRRIVAFDGLHDWDNVVPALRHARLLGADTLAWLIFSESPVHTDALYVEKAKEIIRRADVAEIVIQDTSGILTVDRVRTLVPAIKAAIGDRPLGLHSHGLVGLPQRTYLEAARLGVDVLYTSIPPLADGNAPPSLVTTQRNLAHAGVTTGLADEAIAEISHAIQEFADAHGLTGGVVQDFDAAHFDHQIPGGVLSNLAAQLEQAGMADRIDAVLAESGRVRAELGWPIQVTPFAQFIAVQATLNVIHGERYTVVPDEVKKYALGYFGKLLAPIDPDVLDRIVACGSQRIALTPPPLQDGVPAMRAAYPGLDDRQRLLCHFFPADAVAAVRSDPAILSAAPDDSIVDLVRSLTERSRTIHVIATGGRQVIEVVTR